MQLSDILWEQASTNISKETDEQIVMATTRIRNIKTLDIIRANNMIPSFNKFSSLNKGTQFDRWDLIPRYLAIEEHFNENEYGWEMFRKLRIQLPNISESNHNDQIVFLCLKMKIY